MLNLASSQLRATLLAACVSLALALPAGAAERVNKGENNLAIQGYDVVAYFTESRPVAGTADFEHVWRNARWRFSSAEHRDLFAGDPQRYAPRYGGFCAGAMALGMRLEVDPEAWAIVDDKLYLTRFKRLVGAFVEDADNKIPKADANWKHLGQVE